MNLLPTLLGLYYLLCSHVTQQTCIQDIDHKKSGVFPVDPIVYIGDHVILYCTVAVMPTKLLPNKTVLIFETKRFDGSKEEVAHTTLIKNDSTLIIAINETLATPLQLSTKSVNYLCRYRCDNSSYQVVGQQYVAIESSLQSPDNLSCVSYNWEDLSCTLNFGTSYIGSGVNITWEWTVYKTWSSCPNLAVNYTNARCTWPDFRLVSYAFRINITNKRTGKRPVVQNYTNIKPDGKYINVLPAPVQNILAVSNSTFIDLTWTHSSHSDKLMYYITYCDLDWHQECKDVNSVRRRIRLDRLIPYTNYTISMVVQPINNGRPTGFCSKFANLTVATSAKVPLFNPKMQPGFYEKVNDTTIILYWRNIPKIYQHGPIRLYNVTTTLLEKDSQQLDPPRMDHMEIPTSERINHTVFYNIWSTSKYRIELSLKNIVGYPHNDSSFLFILPLTQRPVVQKVDQFTVLAVNETYVSITWADQRQTLTAPVTNITNYSIVWCRKHRLNNRCLGELQCKLELTRTHELKVKLKDSMREYRFGMSVEAQTKKGEIVSSGIVWGKSVPYLMYGVPTDPPPNVTFSHTSTDGFNVTWGPYSNTMQDYGPVLVYQVTYCSDQHDCTDVNVTGSRKEMRLHVSKLSPGTYSCSVRGIFLGGHGPRSEEATMVMGGGVVGTSSMSTGEGDNSGTIIGAVVVASLVVIVIIIAAVCKFRKKLREADRDTREFDLPVVDKLMRNGDLRGESNDSGVVDDGKYFSDDDPTKVAFLPQMVTNSSSVQVGGDGQESSKAPLLHKGAPLIHKGDSRDLSAKGYHSTKQIGLSLNPTCSGTTSGVGSAPSSGMDTGQTPHPSSEDWTSGVDHSGQLTDDDSGGRATGDYRKPCFADSSVESYRDSGSGQSYLQQTHNSTR